MSARPVSIELLAPRFTESSVADPSVLKHQLLLNWLGKRLVQSLRFQVVIVLLVSVLFVLPHQFFHHPDHAAHVCYCLRFGNLRGLLHESLRRRTGARSICGRSVFVDEDDALTARPLGERSSVRQYQKQLLCNYLWIRH